MKLQRPVLAKIGGRTATKTPWPKGYSPDIVWSLFAAFSASWQQYGGAFSPFHMDGELPSDAEWGESTTRITLII